MNTCVHAKSSPTNKPEENENWTISEKHVFTTTADNRIKLRKQPLNSMEGLQNVCLKYEYEEIFKFMKFLYTG
jgi:hypothetical protein